MGAYATALPGGEPVTAAGAAALSAQYGFPVPAEPGLTAEAMLEAAERGDLDVLWTSGGNFLDVLPDPARVAGALSHVPLRVHQDIVVASQMLVDGHTVLLLPAATRYEQRDGGTETTTERRIVFSPQVPGPRVGEARSEWEIFADVARRTHPARAAQLGCASGAAIRAEIAAVVPRYAGIETLRRTGDAVQWGGPHLCADGAFPTDDGRARFTAVAPRPAAPSGGPLRLATRRGKQFNTMVLAERDPLTGAGRDAVFLARPDADQRDLRDGDAVIVRSPHGELRGRVHLAPLRAGNVQVFFPEGNVLLALGRRGESGVPDYTTDVEVLAAP
jgi:predicted molibdopterin-dependent oxidoreductase YjgC